jgi:glycosyltransferase involved in cell wall biosynthesis
VSRAQSVWGAERIMLRTAPLLVSRGVIPRLACPAESPLRDEWVALGLDWVRLQLPSHRGLRRPDGTRPSPLQLIGEARGAALAVPAIARLAGTADVLHSQSLDGHLEVAVAGRLRGRPTILQIHDLVAPGVGRRVLGTAASLAAHTLAISAAVAACVAGPARRRVEVLHHGIDLHTFTPGPPNAAVRAALARRPADPIVGILGRIDPEKGVNVLLDAIGRLDARFGVQCAVIGAPMRDASWAERLLAEARDQLGERVRVVPPRRDVADVLRALDVVVNASSAEPLGLTLIEAQACGVPVIATTGGGAAEVVADGETGLLVPPGDAGALAGAVSRLLGDPDLRSGLGRAGRRRALRCFDQETYADRLADLYRSVLR